MADALTTSADGDAVRAQAHLLMANIQGGC